MSDQQISSHLNKKQPDELDLFSFDFDSISSENLIDELRQKSFESQPLNVEPGSVLYNQGDKAEYVYFINDGLVKLIKYLPNGKFRIVRLHSKTNIIGLNGLFDEVYEHTAATVNATKLERIPVQSLRQLREQDSQTYDKIITKWNSYLKTADTWITLFSTGSIKARVARLITYLSYLTGKDHPDRVELLTVEDLAAILGVTPESVSRVLADMKRKDILTPEEGESKDTYRRDSEVLSNIAQDE